MAGLFGVGARKCESMKAWTGVFGVCFFCRMSVFAGRGGVVSGAGIKSDGRWWCKLIIAGTYVGKVYISRVLGR